MIRIKPNSEIIEGCKCSGNLVYNGLLWQGMHLCYDLICDICQKTVIKSLPLSQSLLEQYQLDKQSGLIINENYEVVKINWYSSKLVSILNPSEREVEMEVKIFQRHQKVLILNTLDYIYGHSLLILFNLQRIIESGTPLGLVVITQPMMEWLIPVDKVAEVWIVKLSFGDMSNYYPNLSGEINTELNRFEEVYLSRGYVIPTNQNIKIESFTGINPYNFDQPPEFPRITFIWREDPGRLWIRSIYLSKLFRIMGISLLLMPFQYLRVRLLLSYLRKRINHKIRLTVAGLGGYYRFPEYIDDQRVSSFNNEIERNLCRVYSESILTIGVHGSSMILPSGHSGMVISLMPSKRWGNFAEDILYVENDSRLSAFQRRILPLNLSLGEIADIAVDMITGREYFLKKFFHGMEL